MYWPNLKCKPPVYDFWHSPENQSKKDFHSKQPPMGEKEHARTERDTPKAKASNELMCTLSSYVVIMHHGNVCFQDQLSLTLENCRFSFTTLFAAKKSESNLNFRSTAPMEQWKQNILQRQTSVSLRFVCIVALLSVLKVHFKYWFS